MEEIAMQTPVTDTQCASALAVRDLSDPAAGPHAMQLALSAITSRLEAAWGTPVRTYRAGPIVTVAENYELLGYGADAPARESRYTRYLDGSRLLRTHTSAMIPQALRTLVAAGDDDDVVVACPGLVYRRDVVDRLHVGEPHQVDLWRVRRSGRLSTAELAEMIELGLSAVLPAAKHRATPAAHPYTTHGLEVEVLTEQGWVELLECGLAGEHVLADAGLDPREWSGLALGLGLDRALMVRKRIDDIRLLRSDDPRVSGQMLTLDPYRPVSSMPPARRDLSIAVASDVTAELLGDRVRAALDGEALEAVEEVAVLAETPADHLPERAIERIGLLQGQKNVLVRLVLRHPTRTLTAAEANAIRDQVYAAIHDGTAHQWTGRDR
jgi:phenylalanyl-tRNA synthetase alpha chain